jgi:hypothetical protein
MEQEAQVEVEVEAHVE